MENHPIPQDITGFKFKLIGDMTVKQFAYLGAGLGLAWVAFILPVTFLIKYPLGFLLGISGAALAFLPFEGRPLDLMISNFIKALFKPTQFLYQKTGGQIYIADHHYSPVSKQQVKQTPISQTSTTSLSGEKLKAYLESLPKISHDKLDEKEAVFFQTLSNMSSPTINLPTSPAPTPRIIPNLQTKIASTIPHIFTMQPMQPHDFKKEEKPNTQEQKLVDNILRETEKPVSVNDKNLKEDANILAEKLKEAKTEESLKAKTSEFEAAHNKVLELEKMLQEAMIQKQELESKLTSMQKQTADASSQQIFTPSVAAPLKTTTNVRKIPQDLKKTTGVPITPEYPNLISGIIKDPRGNPLSNILIEVMDAQGNPVRAFKTNSLGQFASATPVANGTYRITFEDQNNLHKFDIIEIDAKGEIIMPIEVISTDQREELRKSLFN